MLHVKPSSLLLDMVSATLGWKGLVNNAFVFQLLCFRLTSVHAASAFPQEVVLSNASMAIRPSTTVTVTQPSNAHHVIDRRLEHSDADSGAASSAESDDPSNFPVLAPPSLPTATATVIQGPLKTVDASSSVAGTEPPVVFTPLVLQSTDEFFKPAPTSTQQQDQPGGRNEITEPNLTATAPCRGCYPVIEITVSGLDFATTPAPELIPITLIPTTIAAGNTKVPISQETDDFSFVIGTETVAPDETVTVDNTPVAIQTTAGYTEVVVGDHTVSLQVTAADPQGQVTDAPIPPIITVAEQTYTADQYSQFTIGTQTLSPGGSPITVPGTTLSLVPAATAIIVNGNTSIIQGSGPTPAVGVTAFTSLVPPVLTINGMTYTADTATQYILGPGTTLTAGGQVTISGTVISLAPSETALVIASRTSSITPVTTVVTLTTPGCSRGGSTMRKTIYLSPSPSGAAHASSSSAGAGRSLMFPAQVTTAPCVIPVGLGLAIWVGVLALWL